MKIMFSGGLLGNEALCYMGREMVKQLEKKGHLVSIQAQPVSGYWEKYFNRLGKGEEDVFILNGHVPYIKELIKQGYENIISITTFETTLPQEWVDTLNLPEVKQVWTISDFCKNLIKDSGVKKEVKVIGIGVDDRYVKKKVNMFPKDNSFKFLNVSAPHCKGFRDRKGLDVLIKAFKKAFGDSQEVLLILKINTVYADAYYRSRGQQFNIYSYLKNLIPEGYDSSNIAVIDSYRSVEQMNNLYNGVDVGVFPNRGEGYGLPLAEMIKVGKPVISTNYGASNEFTDASLRISVGKMQSLDVNEHPYHDKPFAEPLLSDLVNIMKNVKEDVKEQKKLAEKHSKTAKITGWGVVGERMNKYLKKIVGDEK